MKEIRREELENVVPGQIRDFNKKKGRKENHLPQWKELKQATNRTPQGLNNAVNRIYGEDISILEFLKDKGFTRSGQWPIDHRRSIYLLDNYISKQLKIREKKPETTRKTRESHLKTVLEDVVEIAGTDDLVKIAQYENKEEKIANNDVFFAVYDSLIKSENGWSRSTVREYTRTVAQLYEEMQKKAPIDHNPAAVARDSYWFPNGTTGKTVSPEDHQIKAYWEAAGTFEEREYIFKIVILILIALGPRPSDILRPTFDAREDIEFEPDPIITYKVRKNNDKTDLPDEVPIMGFVDILKNHVKKLEEGTVPYIDGDGENWDGSLLPAVDDRSGSISAQTLRNWLQELEEVADTNYGEDGDDYLKPKSWRSRWFTEYRSALSSIKPRQKLVADDQGSSNIKLAEDAYVDDKQLRSDIRDEARDEIMSVLPDPTIPAINEASDNHIRTPTLDKVRRHEDDLTKSQNLVFPTGAAVQYATITADLIRGRHKSDNFSREMSSLSPLKPGKQLTATKLITVFTIISAGLQMGATDGLVLVGYGFTLLMAWAFYRDINTVPLTTQTQS